MLFISSNLRRMQFRIFTIPIVDGRAVEDEMNQFLRGHKIVSVDKQFVDTSASWSFCITYVENTTLVNSFSVKKEKIDYKEVLDEKTFLRFSKLREARKQIANEEAIPAYSVFTNEELAEIAAIEELRQGCIISINGIGQKRAEKYEKRLLSLYNNLSEE